jgi:hypothetical protein
MTTAPTMPTSSTSEERLQRLFNRVLCELKTDLSAIALAKAENRKPATMR